MQLMMDTAFLLDEGGRANFLQILMHSFGCTYICVCCLRFLDGLYHEENNQPSSSSGSLAQRLYNEYQQSVFNVDHDRLPGLAFKYNHPYIEVIESNLRRLSSNEIQQQFYKEARIKVAVFMGCKRGEIELGWSNIPQINIEMEMKTLFPEEFSRQSPLKELPQLPTNQNPLSSSSSSFSSDYSSFLFNIPKTTNYIQEFPLEQEVLKPIILTPTSPTSAYQQAMQALGRIRNIQLPTLESEHDAMTRAILAVITSPSSASSSASHQPQQNLSQPSAFKNYTPPLAPMIQVKPNLRRLSMLKRAITYFRYLNLSRIQERMQGSRLRSTHQLHHVMSERRRRSKINESFQTLKSLLPPGSKKDKVSVLASTKEYLTSLRAQVEELSQRNQSLEAQLLPAVREGGEEALDVRVSPTSESSSEERIVELRVSVRGRGDEGSPILDMVIRILEFLKRVRNVSVMSIEANTYMMESSSINRVNFILKIEDSEWDESAFREAVKRVVGDLSL